MPKNLAYWSPRSDLGTALHRPISSGWTPLAPHRCDKHGTSQNYRSTKETTSLGTLGVSLDFPPRGAGILSRGRVPWLAPRRKPGLLHVCPRGDQHNAQEDKLLARGLNDRRDLCVTKRGTRR